MRETGENTGVGADESQKQERSDRGSKESRQNRTFCVGDGPLSSQELGVGASISKIQSRVVLRGDIVKDDSGSYAVFTEQGSSV